MYGSGQDHADHSSRTQVVLVRRARFTPTAFEAISFQRSYLRARACSEEQGVEIQVVDEAVGSHPDLVSGGASFCCPSKPAMLRRGVDHFAGAMIVALPKVATV